MDSSTFSQYMTTHSDDIRRRPVAKGSTSSDVRYLANQGKNGAGARNRQATSQPLLSRCSNYLLPLAALTALALAVRLYALDYPGEVFFDEVHFGYVRFRLFWLSYTLTRSQTDHSYVLFSSRRAILLAPSFSTFTRRSASFCMPWSDGLPDSTEPFSSTTSETFMQARTCRT